MPKKKNLWDNSSLQQDIQWDNQTLPGITDEELYNTNWNRGVALLGKKRPDQSERMVGENNPMAGKVHPNKGKSLPHIGRKGQKKPPGHAENISKARKGKDYTKTFLGKKRPDHAAAMKDPEKNKGAAAMKEIHSCIHCGKTTNLPNYSRWHGDKCKHKQ